MTSPDRPSNRRAIIAAEATLLFARHGFDFVGMSDIAQAVGVQPSALYRHYPSKQVLLDEILRAGVDDLRSALLRLDHFEPGADSYLSLAEYAIDRRNAVALVGREMPHLTATSRSELRAGVRELGSIVQQRVAEGRQNLDADHSELLAWAALAVLQVPVFHRSRLPRIDQALELADLFNSAWIAELPSCLDGRQIERTTTSGLASTVRSELILAEAVRLFTARTYSRVSLDDIGSAMGMAGPSIYYYYDSKSDLLVTALSRMAAYIAISTADALTANADPTHGLRSLVRTYAAFAMEHPELITLTITEVRSLPEPHRQRMVDAERAFVAELVGLLCQAQPDLHADVARIRVHAALTVINNVARTRRLRVLGGVTRAICDICFQMLRLPVEKGDVCSARA